GPTTLGSASGSAISAPSPKRRRLGLIAGVGALLVSGVIVAAVVMTGRGSDAGGSAASRDAAVAMPATARDAAPVLAAVPDAAAVAVASDAGVGEDRIRAKLHSLAEQGKWVEILDIADLDPDDPEVASARKHYLDQQRAELDKAVARGDCNRAK